MFMNPHISSQLARQQQHEMLAQAAQQRLARQLPKHARPSRRAGRTNRLMTRVLRRTRPATLPA